MLCAHHQFVSTKILALNVHHCFNSYVQALEVTKKAFLVDIHHFRFSTLKIKMAHTGQRTNFYGSPVADHSAVSREGEVTLEEETRGEAEVGETGPSASGARPRRSLTQEYLDRPTENTQVVPGVIDVRSSILGPTTTVRSIRLYVN